MPSSLSVGHELLEILVVQFVEQLLGILRVEPEDLVGSGTGEGLTNLTAVSVILHLDDHPAFGVKSGLSDAACGIHADIDKCTGDGHVCPGCSVALGDGRVPAFPFEIVSEGLCRGLAEGAVGKAEVTLPAPEVMSGAETRSVGAMVFKRLNRDGRGTHRDDLLTGPAHYGDCQIDALALACTAAAKMIPRSPIPTI